MIPQKITKLLITNPSDEKYLAYRLGQHNLYLEAYRMLKTQKNDHSLSSIAMIKYDKKQDVIDFIKDFSLEDHANVSRIFKTGVFHSKKGLNPKAFLYTAATNLLALTSGKTIRIKSQSKELQKKFYEICLEVNANKSFGVKFDFDEYDAKIELRQYTELNGRIWIVILSDLSKFLD